jgi:hypothetical protein
VAVARKPAETLLSWRKYGGVLAQAKVGDIAEDLAKAVDKDWREWRKWRDENNPDTLRVHWTISPDAGLAMTGVSWDDVGTPAVTVDPVLRAAEAVPFTRPSSNWQHAASSYLARRATARARSPVS